jgi:Zn-dependent protease
MNPEIIVIAFYLAILVYSVIIHEVSHGVVALWFGDQTAKYAGRLTLNPMKHIDPFGSVILPVLLAVTTGFAFGWAKPVPYNPYNLRNQKWGEVMVGLAGPLSNFLLATIAATGALLVPLSPLAKTDIVRHFYGLISGGDFLAQAELFSQTVSGSLPHIFFGIALMVIFWNVVLGCFNLLPFPPLDGSKLLYALVPLRDQTRFFLDQYGIYILFAVIFFFPYPVSYFVGSVFRLFLDVII